MKDPLQSAINGIASEAFRRFNPSGDYEQEDVDTVIELVEAIADEIPSMQDPEALRELSRACERLSKAALFAYLSKDAPGNAGKSSRDTMKTVLSYLRQEIG